MILKIIRPYNPNADKILMHNQSRSIVLRVPYQDTWKSVFDATLEEYLFYKATVTAEGGLEISGRPLNYDPGW